MISPTGNNGGRDVIRQIRMRNPSGHDKKHLAAFTFVEVMVVTAILAAGIVFVFQSFFLTLNVLNHAAYRSYALISLNNKMAEFKKNFQLEKKILLGQHDGNDQMILKTKKVDFHYALNLENIHGSTNLYKLTGFVSWNEGQKTLSMSRAIYLAQWLTQQDLAEQSQ